MQRQQIIDKVNDILVQEFEVDPAVITPEARLRDEIQLDSLDAVDFIVRLDKTFGIKVAPARARAIASLSGVYDYLEELLSGVKT